jgi:hypothetical protein
MNEVIILTPEEALTEFSNIQKYITVAHITGTSETSLPDIMGKILSGSIQAWISRDDKGSINCVGTTEFLNYTSYRALHIITLGGENGLDLNGLHSSIESFARHHECSCILFWGRKGWEKSSDKISGKYGEKYRETYRVFSMELNNDI